MISSLRSVVVGDNPFIQDNDDEEEGRLKDKKAGRRKIEIESIQDKSRRDITFPKRKTGTMKVCPSLPGVKVLAWADASMCAL